jgi:hypothetical protein
MAGTLRSKTVRLLVEVVSVVFAVLVALAVDELRQDHAERQQAEAARAAVLAEVHSNLEELRRTRPSLDSLETLLAAIRDSTEGGRSSRGESLHLELPDFSDAAWRTAQMTQATAHLPLPWLIRVSKAYEAQGLYESLRTDVIRTFGSIVGGQSETGLQRLGAQVGVLQDVGRGLEAKYDTIFMSSAGASSTPDTLTPGERAGGRDTIHAEDTIRRTGGGIL